jgi:PAS domain S-box-containing protein/putative nucleotidyltransferase with HDIG domain
LVHGGPRGRRLLAAAAALSALTIYGVATVFEQRYGDAFLFGLVIPLTLGVGAWGLRGGILIGALCSALAALWWTQNGQPDGTAWVVSRAAACLGIGLLLGWFLDAARQFSRDLAHHQEFSPDLMVTSNFEGRFTRVSPSVTRVLGYSRQEFLAQPFLDFVHPEDVEPTLAAIAHQQDGNELFSFQNRYLAKDGTYRWLEWTSRPDLAAGVMLAVARDISERKELEARERAYQESLESAVHARTLELEESTRELMASHHETLMRLALAAEYRDDDTQAHTYRVADMAASIAAELGLDGRAVKLIREAALLHDVGKVGIPDAILFKRGRLDSDEFDIVKSHAEIGRSILTGSGSEILRAAEEIAAFHHEWWDGSGYPKALTGEEIPLNARIVALADVFDALMTSRPYKDAWPRREALAEITRLRGLQFDPAVVDAFDRLQAVGFAQNGHNGLVAVRAHGDGAVVGSSARGAD